MCSPYVHYGYPNSGTKEFETTITYDTDAYSATGGTPSWAAPGNWAASSTDVLWLVGNLTTTISEGDRVLIGADERYISKIELPDKDNTKITLNSDFTPSVAASIPVSFGHMRESKKAIRGHASIVPAETVLSEATATEIRTASALSTSSNYYIEGVLYTFSTSALCADVEHMTLYCSVISTSTDCGTPGPVYIFNEDTTVYTSQDWPSTGSSAIAVGDKVWVGRYELEVTQVYANCR